MKKIVTLTGDIDSKKDWVARKLAENSDVEYIHPYVGIDLPQYAEASELAEYNVVLPDTLDQMMRHNNVLWSVEINGKTYAYLEFQMIAPFNVIVVDDVGISDIKEKWDGDVYSILVVSKHQKDGGRSYSTDPHIFDEIFDADFGDLDELEAKIYG